MGGLSFLLSAYSGKIPISNGWELCLNMHRRIKPRTINLHLNFLMFVSFLLKF